MPESAANLSEPGPVLVPAAASAGVEEMSFTWKYTHKLDGQLRVQMPSDWRPADPNCEFMLSIWHHKPSGRKQACVKGFTKRIYNDLVRKVDAMPLGDESADALRHALFENTIKLKLDAAGRLVLPKEMVTAVGLGKEVFFVGLGTQFELWNEADYKQCREAEAALSADAFKRI